TVARGDVVLESLTEALRGRHVDLADDGESWECLLVHRPLPPVPVSAPPPGARKETFGQESANGGPARRRAGASDVTPRVGRNTDHDLRFDSRRARYSRRDCDPYQRRVPAQSRADLERLVERYAVGPAPLPPRGG